MVPPEKFAHHIGSENEAFPSISWKLTPEQIGEVTALKWLPPHDGWTRALKDIPANLDHRNTISLIQFRGTLLSETIAIEYLLTAIPIWCKLKGQPNFYTRFAADYAKSTKPLGPLVNGFKDWVRLQSKYLKHSKKDLGDAFDRLVRLRNALSHYPIQGISLREHNAIVPFVYHAKKDITLVFDTDALVALNNDFKAINEELIMQKHRLGIQGLA